MQGLFYSVTATFTTLVLALILFVVEHYQQFSSSDLHEAQQTRAQAVFLLEALRDDVQHMVVAGNDMELSDFSCRVNMTRNGRTRVFTFPTLRQLDPEEEPSIVQVTYISTLR